jgi:hypothetical protein
MSIVSEESVQQRLLPVSHQFCVTRRCEASLTVIPSYPFSRETQARNWRSGTRRFDMVSLLLSLLRSFDNCPFSLLRHCEYIALKSPQQVEQAWDLRKGFALTMRLT